MFVHETGQLNPRFIINFPTKRHWRGKSRMQDIESGLVALIAEIRERGIRSIALPPLGCGLGGLDWNEVRPRIEAALNEVPEVRAVVFEPSAAPLRCRDGQGEECPAHDRRPSCARGPSAALSRRIDGSCRQLTRSL